MKKQRILFIEPDKVLGKVYSDYFRSLGYDVILEMHAQDAIYAADVQKPDIVILELQLAQHNGIEFLQEFRTYPEWSEIPLIVHTLVPPDRCQLDSFTCRDFGICHVLYKPATSLSKLRRVIDTVSQAALIE